jgi:hypothetical protein
MPNTTNIIEDGQVNTDPFPLQDGVRTPGFFNIPTCYYDTMATMLDTKDVRQQSISTSMMGRLTPFLVFLQQPWS